MLHRILEVNARAVTDYLNAQIDAGAQVVMLFDTWGGSLDTAGYEEFSLAYVRKVLAAQRAPARPVDPVHQGRRRLAGDHGGERLRVR